MLRTDEQMRDEGCPTRFDNTMLTGFDSECRRKFYLFWRGLDYEIRPAYFSFGTAWDKGLGAFYTTKGDVGFRLEAAFKAATLSWEASGSPPDNTNSLENLQFLLTFYAIDYETEQWQVIAPGGEMELGFVFPLRDTKYELAGAMDGYIEWKGLGLLHLENKTSGMPLNDRYMAQWDFSPQLKQYHWGLWQLLGEEPFGTLMNCAHKKLTIKAKDAFRNEGDVPEGCFGRYLVKKSGTEIEQFEVDCLRIIEEMEIEWERWEWRKTRWQFNCVGGMGKSPCPYKRLCITDALPWEMSEQQLCGPGLAWRKEIWEPWKRGEEEEHDKAV